MLAKDGVQPTHLPPTERPAGPPPALGRFPEPLRTTLLASPRELFEPRSTEARPTASQAAAQSPEAAQSSAPAGAPHALSAPAAAVIAPLLETLTWNRPDPRRSVWLWGARISGLLLVAALPSLVTLAVLGRISYLTAGGALMLLAGAWAAVLHACYRNDPSARAGGELEVRLARERAAWEASRRSVWAGRDRIRDLKKKYDTLKSRFENLRQEVREESLVEQRKLREAGQRRLDELAARRRELVAERSRFLTDWETASTAAAAHFVQEEAALEARIETALAQRLESFRTEELARTLAAARLEEAEIAGIGPKLLAKLAAAGVHTAADCDSERLLSIEKFGPKKAQTLLDWRAGLEAAARDALPWVLPAETMVLERERFGAEAAELVSRKTEHEAERQRRRRQADTQIASRLERVDAAARDVRDQTRAAIDQTKRSSEDVFHLRGPQLVAEAEAVRDRYHEAIDAALLADDAAAAGARRVDQLREWLDETPRFTWQDYASLCILGRTPPCEPRVSFSRRPAAPHRRREFPSAETASVSPDHLSSAE